MAQLIGFCGQSKFFGGGFLLEKGKEFALSPAQRASMPIKSEILSVLIPKKITSYNKLIRNIQCSYK